MSYATKVTRAYAWFPLYLFSAKEWVWRDHYYKVSRQHAGASTEGPVTVSVRYTQKDYLIKVLSNKNV